MLRVPDARFIVAFDRASEADSARMGGKCAGLARMIAAGVNVPNGFAITTDAYAEHLETGRLRGRIESLMRSIDIGNVDDEEEKSSEIRRLIMSAAMPAGVEAEIRRAYRAIAEDDDLPVAVRSSATAEDMPDASFAGQQDTYLWIVGEDDVVGRVKACWASLFNARAISYRAKNGLGWLDAQMCVGVQKMVDAVAAGVAMTLDPITGNRTRIVIDSAFGLGEPVVSGEITPDNFVVEKVMLEILKRKVVEKDRELVADRAARRTVHKVVEASRRALPSLSDAQVIAVARLAKALEKSMGCPQDVEWAIDRDLPDGENIVILQSRPETVWSRKKVAREKTYAVGIEGVLGALLSPLRVKQ